MRQADTRGVWGAKSHSDLCLGLTICTFTLNHEFSLVSTSYQKSKCKKCARSALPPTVLWKSLSNKNTSLPPLSENFASGYFTGKEWWILCDGLLKYYNYRHWQIRFSSTV